MGDKCVHTKTQMKARVSAMKRKYIKKAKQKRSDKLCVEITVSWSTSSNCQC